VRVNIKNTTIIARCLRSNARQAARVCTVGHPERVRLVDCRTVESRVPGCMKSLPKRALRPVIGSAGARANMTIWECRPVLGVAARLSAGRPNFRMVRHPGASRPRIALSTASTRYSGSNGGGIEETELARPSTDTMWGLDDGQTDLLYAHVAGWLYRG
jgi:hypothetical protein